MRIRTRPRATKIAASSRASPPLERKFAARRRSRRRERENLRGRKENPRIERRTPRRANRRNRRLEPDGFPALVRAGAAVVLPTSMRTSQTTLPDSAPTSSHPPSRRAARSLALVRAGGSRRRGLEGGRKARGGCSSGPGPGRGSGEARRRARRIVMSTRGGVAAGQVGPARAEAREAGSVRGKSTQFGNKVSEDGGNRCAARGRAPFHPASPAFVREGGRDAPPMRSLVSLLGFFFSPTPSRARASAGRSPTRGRLSATPHPPGPDRSPPRLASPLRVDRIRTRRQWKPNAHRKKLYSETLGEMIQLNVHDPRPALGG